MLKNSNYCTFNICLWDADTSTKNLIMFIIVKNIQTKFMDAGTEE
jgi:hypothetical protein